MEFGVKIALLRTQKGYSQEKVAHWLKVSEETLEEWEKGTASPDVNQLKLLSEVFGVSPNELLNEEPITESHESDKASDTGSKKRKWIIIAVIVALTFFAIAVVVAAVPLLPHWFYEDINAVTEVGASSNLPLKDTEAVTEVPIAPVPFSKDTDAIAKATESVVKILCFNYDGKEVSTGSGFVFNDGKTIITNYHVIDDAYTAKISTDQDLTYDINQILTYSEDKDIAILSLEEDVGLIPLEVGDPMLLRKGEAVTAIGSPLGITNSVSQGILSGRIFQNSMDILQFTAPISSGSSGGALFSEDGTVVGITFASFIDGQNLNLAIPITEAISLLESKSLESSLQKLYTKNNPYIKYLSQYEDAIEVTLEDLQENPFKYHGKIIKVRTFISSLIDSGYIAWCSNLDNISGDFEADREHYFGTHFEDNGLINLWLPYHFYEDALCCTPEVGNEIIVIGEFRYVAIGGGATNKGIILQHVTYDYE